MCRDDVRQQYVMTYIMLYLSSGPRLWWALTAIIYLLMHLFLQFISSPTIYSNIIIIKTCYLPTKIYEHCTIQNKVTLLDIIYSNVNDYGRSLTSCRVVQTYDRFQNSKAMIKQGWCVIQQCNSWVRDPSVTVAALQSDHNIPAVTITRFRIRA